jgi:hypothetical protein
MGSEVTAATRQLFSLSRRHFQLHVPSCETNDKLHADIHAIFTRTANCSTLDVRVFAIG